MRVWLSLWLMRVNTGRSLCVSAQHIFAHSRTARTGHNCGLAWYGTPMVWPSPCLSVFACVIVICRPSGMNLICDQVRLANSLRRIAPHQPNNNTALSRIPRLVSMSRPCNICSICSTLSGRAFTIWRLFWRRKPAKVSRTNWVLHGLAMPGLLLAATSCHLLMLATWRCKLVNAVPASVRSTKYAAISAAGIGLINCQLSPTLLTISVLPVSARYLQTCRMSDL